MDNTLRDLFPLLGDREWRVVNRDFIAFLFIARLNLSDGPQCDRMAAVDAQRRSSTDANSSYPGQSRSFRILQMMTGGDDETGNANIKL